MQDVCPGQTVVLREAQIDHVVKVVKLGRDKQKNQVLVRLKSKGSHEEAWVRIDRLLPFRASSAPQDNEVRRPSLVSTQHVTYESPIPKGPVGSSTGSPDSRSSSQKRTVLSTPKGHKRVSLAQSPVKTERDAGLNVLHPLQDESESTTNLVQPNSRGRLRVRDIKNHRKEEDSPAAGLQGAMLNRPRIRTGFDFSSNEEGPSPGSTSSSPLQKSPPWPREGPELNDEREWEEAQRVDEVDEEITEDGGRSGETTLSMGEASRSVSMVHYKWRKGSMIGSGSYGRVYLGMNLSTGELIAVKQLEYLDNVEADREKVESLEQEIEIMRTLRHPNVCGYLGTERSENEDTKILNILLEYVPGGSISQLLEQFGAFGEHVIRLFTRQILLGLQYLHANKLAHRDIKGANILVTSDGCVKLSDFGHSKRLEETAATLNFNSLKGTPFWMAPEVIKQEGHGRRADIWSVGCTVVEMASGKPPWSELSNAMTAMFAIASSEEPPAIPDTLSAEAHGFVGLCFKRNPIERPNATELLKHPFVKDTCQIPKLTHTGSALFSCMK